MKRISLNNLSIQSKLMLMLLLVSTVSIATIGGIAYSNGRAALTAAAYKELTNVRTAKKRQIEAFFKNIRNHTANLANDRMIVSAMREMDAGFRELHGAEIDPKWDAALRSYYQDVYLPKLAQVAGQTPRLDAFLPGTAQARYAQYWYLAANRNPAPERYKLIDAGDGSAYSAVHARYQAIFTKLMLDFGYDNMMLADAKSGGVVYTFGKSQIFGTSLADGPYSRSSAGDLFRSVVKSQNWGEVQTTDFADASYAFGKPVALMAAPILDGPDQLGVLFLQFPLTEINRTMTDNFNWEAAGMGKTGKSYLVGPDMLMRSTARALYENPEKFYAGLEKAGYSAEDRERIRRVGHETLTMPVRTKYVEAALAGKSGTTVDINYVGNLALISYAPLDIPGLRWAVISEVSEGEAFASLNDLNRGILISAVFLILGVSVAAAILGRRFVTPIFRLVDAAKRLRGGEPDVRVKIESKDEFHDLGEFFNGMSSDLSRWKHESERGAKERERLIGDALPGPAAERMKQGLPQTPDRYGEVSILYADFASLYADAAEPGADGGVRAFLLMRDLMAALDDAADLRGVDKLSANGSTLVAACGLSRERLDQASRILEFARDIVKSVKRLNRDQRTAMSVRIGVASGPATGGVVGRTRLSYHLFGDAMTACRTLANHVPPGSRGGILVTHPIYAASAEWAAFGEPVDVNPPVGGPIRAWPLLADAPETQTPMAQSVAELSKTLSGSLAE